MKNNNKYFWYFLMPALFAFTFVIIIPFALGIFYSFTDWTGFSVAEINWVGLDNYKGLFQDPQFVYSLIYTFIFAGISIILINVVAFGLATLLTRGWKGENFFRGIFFVPNLIGGLVLGYIWQFIFNQAFVQMFEQFGYASPLVDPVGATIATSAVLTWQYAGYIMLIYIAAINNIPKDMIEAAEIDGANKWNILKIIKVPMLMPAFTVTLFLTIVNSFKQFDAIYSLTYGNPPTQFAGELVYSTQTLAIEIYKTAYASDEMAVAQAEAIIFFIILLIITLIQVGITKSKEVEA